MPYVNEKLLRLALVLLGLATLGGFGWKMYDFVQNQDAIVRKLSMAKLEGTFGAVESTRFGGHLLKYEHYKVLQDLNITGYVPPPPVLDAPVNQKSKPRIEREDIEVPWIQAPTAAWIQGRGEQSTPDYSPGDLVAVGDHFQIATKEGLDLQLVAVRPGEVEIEVVEDGKRLLVQSLAFEVDNRQVYASDSALFHGEGAKPGLPGTARQVGQAGFPPAETQQISPGVFAVGTKDAERIERMSQEEILAAIPVRVVRDPMSNEVKGLRVRSVPEDSVFARLGIQADDIVLEVNGQAAVDRDQLFATLRQLDTDTLVVKVERLGGIRQLSFRLPR